MTPQKVVEVLENVAGSDLEVPTILALGTGMRLGEVLGLRWCDVDLDKKTARISQAVQETIEGSFSFLQRAIARDAR